MKSTVWLDSPVAETLAVALEAILPGRLAKRFARNDKEYVVLSYKEDFAYLWQLEGDDKHDLIQWISSGGNKLRNVVLIWDKIPESTATTINIADYVTPYDWALVCSKIVFSKQRHSSRSIRSPWGELPELRIVILDLDSQEHSGAFASGAFLAVGYSLPWIQIYKPTQTDRHELLALQTIDNESTAQLRSAVAPGSLGLETFFADILSYHNGLDTPRSLSLRAAQTEQDRHQIMDSLTGLWQSSLVRPGDRHHVGNLLAPVLLAKGLPDDLERKVEINLLKNNPLHDALRVLLDVIGLEGASVTSKADVPNEGILQALRSESDTFDRRSSVNVVLVDDQFRLGYHHILSAILFGTQYEQAQAIDNDTSWVFEKKGTGTLRCEATADTIFKVLEDALPVIDWFEPRLFQPTTQGDILILDLRLWTEPKERGRFLVRLIDICKKIGATATGDSWTPLSDPAFRKAFERAKAIVGAGDRDANEIESLVLLPLLISYYDPSVPIVLFSSTHQRSILQMVSHRKNIIADFAKPILSGYGEERQAAESVEDLRRAVVEAIKLHEARAIWERLIGFEWRISPVFECASGKKKNGERTLKVYNIPPSAQVNAALRPIRLASGRMLPRLDGRDLRALLANHFMDYIQGGRQFDFASIPWEILEGNLVPKKLLRDPNIVNPDFGIMPDLVTPRQNRNLIARALELVRHKKAHGTAPPAVTDTDRDDYRLGAMLQFSLLLDFMGGASVAETPFQTTIDHLWRRIQRRNYHLSAVYYTLEPARLSPDVRVTWLDFVIYTVLWYATNAVDNGIRFLSADTVMQIERMAQHSIARP